MIQDHVQDPRAVSLAHAQQAPARIGDLRSAGLTLYPVAEALVVDPGDTGHRRLGKADIHLLGRGFDAEELSLTQFGEHRSTLSLCLQAAAAIAKPASGGVAWFARGKGRAVRLALGGDASDVGAPQVDADGACDLAALSWRGLGHQRAHQLLELGEITHAGTSHSPISSPPTTWSPTLSPPAKICQCWAVQFGSPITGSSSTW